MKKAPNSQNSEKPENEHGNEAVSAFFKDLGKCHPMTRKEEQEYIKEMVRIRDERDLLVEAINQKNPEEVSDDERNKLQKAQRAYEKIRNIFISRNLRLVAKIAKRYIKVSGIEITDLVNEGSIGIMRAVDKFDPEVGVRFATYAGHWIRQAMNRTIQNHARTVRCPIHIHQLANKVKKIQREALSRGETEPTVEEIAAQVGKSVEVLKRVIAFQQASISSLDAPINSGDSSSESYIDWVSDEDMDLQDEALDRKRDIEQVHKLVESLDPRDKRIIELRYGLEDEDVQTLQAIGHRFGVSRERIRQIDNEIRRRLRKKLMQAIEAPEVV
ncbi:MAG: sigma-70 family RNA polymerase sigma factor [Candidatus Gracilibacteria bacterium]